MALWGYLKKPVWDKRQEQITSSPGGGLNKNCPGWLLTTQADDRELLVCIHLREESQCFLDLEDSNESEILQEDGSFFMLERCP